MPEKIRVLVIDSDPQTHQQVASQVAAAGEIQLVGPLDASGQAPLEAVAALRPDVMLVDLGLPDLRGLRTAEAITANLPWVSVIIVSTAADPDYLRRAMLAGARHFIVKPFTDGELPASVREVYRLDASRRAAHAVQAGWSTAALEVAPAPRAREGEIFTFYSAKGGIGCTTIACNLAVYLKQTTGKEVAIFDCGLLFGDVGVVLNLNPKHTIIDLLPRLGPEAEALDGEFLHQTMVTHASGLKVLLAPQSPEKAELITADHVHKVLAALRANFDYVIIDTWPTFEERILHVLDASDKIVVPTTLEMPAIKNSKLLLDVTNALAYADDKILMVLNRADSRGGIRVQDVEQILQKRFAAEIVSDGRLTTLSLNEGAPFVMTHPDAAISRNIAALGHKLTGGGMAAPPEPRPSRAGGLLRAVLGV